MTFTNIAVVKKPTGNRINNHIPCTRGIKEESYESMALYTSFSIY